MNKGGLIFGVSQWVGSDIILGQVYPHPISGLLIVTGMSGVCITAIALKDQGEGAHP